MFAETVQLEILDEIVKTQHMHNFELLDFSKPHWEHNYQRLLRERYIEEVQEKVGVGIGDNPYRDQTYKVRLTTKGDQRRFELREKFVK